MKKLFLSLLIFVSFFVQANSLDNLENAIIASDVKKADYSLRKLLRFLQQYVYHYDIYGRPMREMHGIKSRINWPKEILITIWENPINTIGLTA